MTFFMLMSAGLYLAFSMVSDYLVPIILGAFLATLSFPLYRALRVRRVGPKFAAATVTLLLVLIIVVPLAGLINLAFGQASVLLTTIAEQQGTLSPKALVERVTQWLALQHLLPDAAVIERQLAAGLQSAANWAAGSALGAASDLPAVILDLALASASCFFLLLDGRRFLNWILLRIPLDRDVQLTLVRSLQETTVSAILATLAAAGVQSLLMLVSFLSLGVPMAVLAAGATFVFAWIPIVGSTPVWVGGAIFLYAQDSPARAVFMILCGFITGISDNLVRPMVLKGKVDMHPLLALVAIFGGIQMFGIFGVFIGPVIAAAVVALLDVWPSVGSRFRLLPFRSSDDP
ncbi:MAG: AI-2E family transporter [Myxococcales bacterium]|nr:AI-2E family transporter [Myxococcales bacterium]